MRYLPLFWMTLLLPPTVSACVGDEPEPPNIDRFAAQGMRFTQALAGRRFAPQPEPAYCSDNTPGIPLCAPTVATTRSAPMT